MIASVDLENSEKQLLATKQAYEQAQISLANVELSIVKLQQTLLELNLNYNDKLVGFQNSLKSNYEQLTTQLTVWGNSSLLFIT